jgi:hypothetical protein
MHIERFWFQPASEVMHHSVSSEEKWTEGKSKETAMYSIGI